MGDLQRWGADKGQLVGVGLSQRGQKCSEPWSWPHVSVCAVKSTLEVGESYGTGNHISIKPGQTGRDGARMPRAGHPGRLCPSMAGPRARRFTVSRERPRG